LRRARSTTNLSIVPFARDHLSELIALVDAEGWEEYSDHHGEGVPIQRGVGLSQPPR
jgi:hypothetical protein